jgi:hypothetical protein
VVDTYTTKGGVRLLGTRSLGQLRLTRADRQRAASVTPSANGLVVRSTMPKN